MSKSRLCPLCHKPELTEFSPFCSSFCRNKDFLSWVNEDYRVPVSPEIPSHQDDDQDKESNQTLE